MARSVEITVASRTTASAEKVFDAIAPIDLTAIFDRWLLLPGVRGVRDQSGAWDAAGQTRIVELDDGSEVPEALTRVSRPHSFAYRVGPFPAPLGALASFADGEWSFTPSRGGTDIRWTYRFHPRSWSRPVLQAFIGPMWRAYATRALRRAVAVAEG